MTYLEGRERYEHGLTHVFVAEYVTTNVRAFRRAVCGFTRAGTFLASTANEDYPICPICNRWLLLLMLGE